MTRLSGMNNPEDDPSSPYYDPWGDDCDEYDDDHPLED